MTDYFAGDPRTNRERMLAGDLYVADDPDSARIARRALFGVVAVGNPARVIRKVTDEG